MVKVSLAKRLKISIKTSFEDCTIADLLAIASKQEKDLILNLTTLTEEQYNNLDVASIEAITTILDFVNDYDNITLPEPSKQIDVGDESFKKIEQAKQSLSNGKQSISDFINLAKIYMGDEWITANANLVLNVISQGLQIFNSIDAFLYRHKDLNDNAKNEDEDAYEEAGIEAIHSYGVFATIYSICDGKPWRYNKLLKCEAETVYMTLRYSKDRAHFERNLTKIKTRQNNGNVSANSRRD